MSIPTRPVRLLCRWHDVVACSMAALAPCSVRSALGYLKTVDAHITINCTLVLPSRLTLPHPRLPACCSLPLPPAVQGCHHVPHHGSSAPLVWRPLGGEPAGIKGSLCAFSFSRVGRQLACFCLYTFPSRRLQLVLGWRPAAAPQSAHLAFLRAAKRHLLTPPPAPPLAGLPPRAAGPWRRGVPPDWQL